MTKQDIRVATPLMAGPAPPSAGTNAVIADPLPVRAIRQRVALALQVDAQRCLSCGGCISVCPRMMVPISHLNSLAAGTLCQGCGLCVQVCPVEALSQTPVFIAEPLRVPGRHEHRLGGRVGGPGSDETH